MIALFSASRLGLYLAAPIVLGLISLCACSSAPRPRSDDAMTVGTIALRIPADGFDYLNSAARHLERALAATNDAERAAHQEEGEECLRVWRDRARRFSLPHWEIEEARFRCEEIYPVTLNSLRSALGDNPNHKLRSDIEVGIAELEKELKWYHEWRQETPKTRTPTN